MLRNLREVHNTLRHGSALQDHMLTLKKGPIVMLFRLLDRKNGHANVTRYVMENMTKNSLFLPIATGRQIVVNLPLPRISCELGDGSLPVPGFNHLRFPVRMPFAITRNEAQG